MQSATFTVDAALLRELGDRLIGRSYIALAELVKNAYDADAIDCRIEFADDRIVIVDNGHGMSEQDFHDHWMRIGTTHKTDAPASPRLGRAMTGSKGLGRLSVQFLADEMTLESTSVDDSSRHLYAFVDWTNIQHGSDLDTVAVLWEMRSDSLVYPDDRPTGTRIVLSKLRSEWNATEIERLGQDVWMLQSPFRRSHRRSDAGTAQDFYVHLDAPGIHGARVAFDKFHDALFENWKARITGAIEDGRVTPTSNVTVEFKADYPKHLETATSFRETVALPVAAPGRARSPGSEWSVVDRARFEILIFKPEHRQPGGIPVGEMRDYLRNFGNVSVYDAGFRLPYYGPDQDWLRIAVDQGRRLVTSGLLPSRLKVDAPYLLDLPAPGRIFGIVEIDTNHERAAAEQANTRRAATEQAAARPGQCLQIQPGRDRLADNAAFEQLRDLVRFSLDFYANRFKLLSLQTSERHRAKEPPSRTFSRAIAAIDRNKAQIPRPAFQEIRREVVAATKAAEREERHLDHRAVLLAPLATAGMTALALNHELARELLLLEQVSDRLRAIAASERVPQVAALADELAGGAERFAALRQLFDPLLVVEDRQATDRLRVRAILLQVVRGLRPLMARVDFRTRDVPHELRFPLGSFAEWSAMLQNLLTNGWNATLDSERAEILFEGGSGKRGREWLRVSDTGVGLDIPLQESETLFEPFERHLRISPENQSISMGGQGLGLTIVRMIAQRRGAQVAFVKPRTGFATTLQVSWRGGPK